MKKDYAGIKFKIMEEQGELIDMMFIKHNKELETQEFYVKSHAESDGATGFALALKKVDQIETTSLPTVKVENRPNIFKRLLLAYKHAKRQSPITYPWKSIDTSKRGVMASLSYAIFNKQETLELENYCRLNNINMNSLLLWTLDKATSSKLLLKKDMKHRMWMVPVNLRQQKDAKIFSGNHVTTLSVKIEDDSPISVHNQIRQMMKSGIIWGGEIVANAPKYIGETALRRLSKSIKSPYFGLCSNLGSWPLQRVDNIDEKSHWVIASPPTRLCPVAGVISKWNSALSISLLFHPSISERIEDSQEFLMSWIKEIQSYTGLELSPKEFLVTGDRIQKEKIQF